MIRHPRLESIKFVMETSRHSPVTKFQRKMMIDLLNNEPLKHF